MFGRGEWVWEMMSVGANHGGLGGGECAVAYGVCIYNRYGLGLRALDFRFQRVRVGVLGEV